MCVLGLLLAACNSGGSETDPSDTDSGLDSKIEMANFAFAPAQLTIPVGTTVTWKNTDAATHQYFGR